MNILVEIGIASSFSVLTTLWHRERIVSVLAMDVVASRAEHLDELASTRRCLLQTERSGPDPAQGRQQLCGSLQIRGIRAFDELLEHRLRCRGITSRRWAGA